MLWLCLFACFSSTNDHHDHADHATVHHRFDDVEKWAAVFDDPERDAWQKPSEVVAAMGVSPNQRVADLGAGTGYLVPYLLEAVGENGRVIALEVENSLVEHLKQRFAGDSRVSARLTANQEVALEPEEVDHIVLLDVYHHISDRLRYFSRLKQRLRPEGRLTIVDFDPAVEAKHGPPPEHRLALAKVTEELTRAGWVSLPPVEESLEEQYIGRFAPAMANVDVDWLATRLETGPVALIDVRTPDEYREGHVPGAQNIPLNTLDPGQGDWDRSQPVVLICQSGGRSMVAAQRFAKEGYAALNIEGGTAAWIRAGREVER